MCSRRELEVGFGTTRLSPRYGEYGEPHDGQDALVRFHIRMRMGKAAAGPDDRREDQLDEPRRSLTAPVSSDGPAATRVQRVDPAIPAASQTCAGSSRSRAPRPRPLPARLRTQILSECSVRYVNGPIKSLDYETRLTSCVLLCSMRIFLCGTMWTAPDSMLRSSIKLGSKAKIQG